jgi:1,4-alpha-glucan branching enzyme/maltooligosyltrehalose trehalohydrolase
MGEEFAAATPFRFFCDFGDDLREAVTQGRRREFATFTRFADPAAQAAIPDPNRVETFLASRLDWDSLDDGAHADWLAYYRQLLQLRREVIVPRLPGTGGHAAAFEVSAADGLRVEWRLGDGSMLRLLANLSSDPIGATAPSGTQVFATQAANAGPGRLAPWSVVWTLDGRDAGP